MKERTKAIDYYLKLCYRWENDSQEIGWFTSADLLNESGDDKTGIHVFLFTVLDVFYYR